MNAGELRDKIDFLKSKPPSGSVINLDHSDPNNWDDYKPGVWGKVEYLNGNEFWGAMTVNSETSIRFIVRYRTDITTDMAVRFQGHIFDIKDSHPLDNKRIWTVIIAKEVVSVAR
jgi:SPP1 family predicted phage head-tail adaptor